MNTPSSTPRTSSPYRTAILLILALASGFAVGRRTGSGNNSSKAPQDSANTTSENNSVPKTSSVSGIAKCAAVSAATCDCERPTEYEIQRKAEQLMAVKAEERRETIRIMLAGSGITAQEEIERVVAASDAAECTGVLITTSSSGTNSVAVQCPAVEFQAPVPEESELPRIPSEYEPLVQVAQQGSPEEAIRAFNTEILKAETQRVGGRRGEEMLIWIEHIEQLQNTLAQAKDQSQKKLLACQTMFRMEIDMQDLKDSYGDEELPEAEAPSEILDHFGTYGEKLLMQILNRLGTGGKGGDSEESCLRAFVQNPVGSE